MIIIKKIKDWKSLRVSNSLKNKTLGFVPTMGALHRGHIELVKKSLRQNDITVVSIFVNPTQFNNKADLQNYSVTINSDIKILDELNVNYLFLPEYKELYPDDYKYKITETDFSKLLCGRFRPGHFDGVLTVVMKLFNIIKPDRAYFGEKDYQQLELIRGMVKNFFMDIKIISVPTVRDKDGLALSSRNLRLNAIQRKIAPKFPEILMSDLSIEQIKSRLVSEGFKVEYVEQIGDRRFAAVYLGKVRLIDNVKI
ncbi:MAG: pantoate--beta-alanine ligase [Ignavibacterium album]|uniref:pantoate--beta-alanine ligase n=1 Tax=Ignavibacterium album TaxID=591197 RepID=UPI0026EB12ED|nr:pantoate--beta-alanine ligase [Ignavibacterium album]MBI5662335.1 pantoate--beta-alanine ligase [Ignavibacterium album]